MNLDLNLGSLLALAGIVVGFAIWGKTTVAVLATRVEQHDRDIAGVGVRLDAEIRSLKKWQVDQDDKFGGGLAELRKEVGEVRERLVRIEALLERIVGKEAA